jgi:hypothetical protein
LSSLRKVPSRCSPSVFADKPLLGRHGTGQKPLWEEYGTYPSDRLGAGVARSTRRCSALSHNAPRGILGMEGLMSRVDVWVEHVDTSNVHISAFATQKSTTVGSRGFRRFGDGSENAVRPMVGRGSTEQLKSVGRSNTQSRSQARRPPHACAKTLQETRTCGSTGATIFFPEFTISHPSEAPLHPAKNNFVSGIVSMVFTAELDLRAEEPLEN